MSERKPIGLTVPYRKLFPKEYTADSLLNPKPKWASTMKGVRVDGDNVVISVKGGNETARELCGELIKEMNK
jgi:hypothetical protein